MSGNTIDIRELAEEAHNADLIVKQVREKTQGFECLINDLADSSNNHEGQGWQLENGWLRVGPGEYNSQEIRQFLDEKMGKYPWWNTEDKYTAATEDTVESTTYQQDSYAAEYADFKVLGARGQNKAADSIIILDDRGEKKLVVVKRNDGTIATPGGFLEEGAHDKAFEELFEERYSGDLFKLCSPSLDEINKLSTEKIKEHLQELFKERRFAVIPNENDYTTEQISQEPQMLESHLKVFMSNTHTHADIKEIATQLKCALYKKCFPEKYKEFRQTTMGNAQQMEEFVVSGDPRNTKGPYGAYMTTQPYASVIQTKALAQAETDAFLEAVGGSDAQESKILAIEDFLSKPVYATHCTMVLNAIATLAEQKTLQVSSEQLKAIEAAVKLRTSKATATQELYKMLDTLQQELTDKQQNEHSPKIISEIKEDISKINAAIKAILSVSDENYNMQEKINSAHTALREVYDAIALRPENGARIAGIKKPELPTDVEVPIPLDPSMVHSKRAPDTEPAPNCWQAFVGMLWGNKQGKEPLVRKNQEEEPEPKRLRCLPF